MVFTTRTLQGPAVTFGRRSYSRIYINAGMTLAVDWVWYNGRQKGYLMGLVKMRRLMAMHKQERAKAGLKSRQLKVTPPPRTRQHQTKI